MHLTFLGTRGGIIARSPLHFMHSVLHIHYKQTKILIDWGEDWLYEQPPDVQGLLLTHGHPDHIGGLANGVNVPIFTSADTWKKLKSYPLTQHAPLKPGVPFKIGSFDIIPFEAFHSIHAPALGYRIQGGKHSIFYASDLIAIKEAKAALSGVNVYIGDGAIVKRRILVREKNGIPVGHSPIKDQLEWCSDYGVNRAIFTHCGSEIVKDTPERVENKIKQLTKESGVSTLIAIDGMQITL